MLTQARGLPPLRILHLSDLHASSESPQLHRTILGALFDDIEAQHQKVPIDFAVVTGDLANAGTQQDLDMATSELLTPLQSRFGLTPESIVLVPGNHDVNRSLITDFVEKGLRAQLIDSDSVAAIGSERSNLALATARLAPWEAFHTDYYKTAPPVAVAPLAFVHRREMRGVSLGVAALNSAWRATGAPNDEDRNHLIVGCFQVEEALSAIADCRVRIVAMHHPLDWLAAFDADDLRPLLRRSGALVLTGHEHSADPTAEIAAGGTNLFCRGGCLYGGRKYPNAYAILDIDLEQEEVQVTIRTWIPQRQVFDEGVSIGPGGVVRLPLPRLGSVADLGNLPKHSQVHNSLFKVVSESSILYDRTPLPSASRPSHILVPARYYPIPYATAAAEARLANERRVTQVDPNQLLKEKPVLVVFGESESGITASLIALLERSYDQDDTTVPLYSRFHVRPGTDPIAALISQKLTDLGVRPGAGGRSPRLIVAFDDVDQESVLHLGLLVRWIRDHPGHKVVLGCHLARASVLTGLLEEAGVNYSVAHLGPLGRAELRELAGTVAQSTDTELVDRIVNVMLREGLPRNPFVMAALVAVWLNGDASTLTDETAILSAYADLLLGRFELEETGDEWMDYRRREHLLESLAAEMWCSRVDAMDSLSVHRFANDYAERKGWTNFPARGVVGSLIDRRLLVGTVDGVRFRHPALRNLFAARFYNEDEAFRSTVLKNPLAFGDVARHAAALSRMDYELLNATSAVAATARHELDAGTIEQALAALERWGAAGTVDMRGVQAQIEAAGAMPVELVNRLLDEVVDQIEMREAVASTGPSSQLSLSQEYARAIVLLSVVLRASDFIEDAAGKEAWLRQVVEGWELVAGLVLTESGLKEFAERLDRALSGDGRPPEVRRAGLEAIAATMGLLIVLNAATANVGTKQLGAAVEAASSDSDLMAAPVRALIVTVLSSELGLREWPVLLGGLLRRCEANGLVWRVALAYGLVRYQSRSVGESDAKVLLRALGEVLTRHAAVAGVRERSRWRSGVETRLRQARARAAQGFLAGADV